MLIERKDIEVAKERLGSQNALIMAELLELDDFDVKNLKSCCPYHDENTASFIYNKKNHTFHCFGCNKTVDIIDVLMEKGKTFLESAKFVFEKADLDYNFGYVSNSSFGIRPVINLKADVTVIGNGTIDNPYIVQ